jgi:hypothetical protein
MTNQELYKQAILDAKAVRETALAAARETLAEAFEPRLKEMVRLSLSEDDMEEAKSTEARDKHDEKMGRRVAKDMEYDQKRGRKHGMEEASDMEESMDMEEAKMHDMEESMDMEESTLDEILAELDALSEDDTVDEAKKQGTTAGYPEKAHTESGGTGYDEKAKVSRGGTGYPEKAKSSIHEGEDEDADMDDEAEEAGEDLTKDMEAGMPEEGGDEQEVVDITVGDLKDIIRDVFMSLQGGGDEEQFDDASLDLDSPDQAMADDEMMGAEDDKEISLEEILAELEEEEMKMEEAASVPGSIPSHASDVNKVDEMKKDLQEAHKAIKAMKHELNEVNLLNAKLLYVNKIFKAKSLNESQKVRVLNAFDRATTIKEAENTYKTLNESIGEASKKSSLKESVGFASKPIGSAPARPIVEADIHVTRWQQLAGIK